MMIMIRNSQNIFYYEWFNFTVVNFSIVPDSLSEARPQTGDIM